MITSRTAGIQAHLCPDCSLSRRHDRRLAFAMRDDPDVSRGYSEAVAYCLG